MVPQRPEDYRQGLWDYADFPEYLNQWIIPNMLGDLETVFEGARERWRGREGAGRGDFALATVLFAWFEHLGAFLGNPDEKRRGIIAIARCAKQLPSINDKADWIIAYLGRNALVHAAWPQTLSLMDGGNWAFGMSVNADNRLQETHNIIYNWPVHKTFPRVQQTPTTVIKLSMNVHILRQELHDFVASGLLLECTNTQCFELVKEFEIGRCRNLFRNRSESGLQEINVRQRIEGQIRWFRNRYLQGNSVSDKYRVIDYYRDILRGTSI